MTLRSTFAYRAVFGLSGILATLLPTLNAGETADAATLEQIIKQATAAIRVDPSALEPYLVRARAHAERGAIDNAISDLTELTSRARQRKTTGGDRLDRPLVRSSSRINQHQPAS